MMDRESARELVEQYAEMETRALRDCDACIWFAMNHASSPEVIGNYGANLAIIRAVLRERASGSGPRLAFAKRTLAQVTPECASPVPILASCVVPSDACQTQWGAYASMTAVDLRRAYDATRDDLRLATTPDDITNHGARLALIRSILQPDPTVWRWLAWD